MYKILKQLLQILLGLLLMLFSVEGFSGKNGNLENNSKSLMPDYLKLQYAGNIGYGSVGIGYFWWRNNVQTEIFYGVVPSWAGGNEIRTVAVKNMVNLFVFRPGKNILIKQQAGFSTNLAFTKKTYFNLPDYYPENYYSPNAIHLMPFFSQECVMLFKSYCFVKKVGFYSECSAIDTYLYQSLKYKQIHFNDAWSLALGMVVSF